MDFVNYFPVWGKLTPAQQSRILGSVMSRTVKKGTVIHNGSEECTGLLLIKSGQLRAYILSEEGREITIYRLFDRDLCLLSASCIMRSIQFEVTIEAEKDTSRPASSASPQAISARNSRPSWSSGRLSTR